MPGSGPLPETAATRRWRGGATLAAALVAAGLAATPTAPAFAQSGDKSAVRPGSRLEDIERERKESETRSAELKRKAAELAREADETAHKMVAVAADARTREQAIADLGTQLAAMRAEEKKRSQGLESRRARLAELLGALERIARNPPEALMAYSHTPQDTLRSAMLLRAAIPKLEAEAQELRTSLDALARLKEQTTARQQALVRERRALDGKRKELAALVTKQRALARTTRSRQADAEKHARNLASQAKDLRELLARIERDRKARAAMAAHRPPPPPGREAHLVLRPPPAPSGLPHRISRAHGRLVQPVVGRVAEHYGDREGFGSTAKGIRFATADGAQVVAPFGGEVVFAGPFRGYGPLLIIDHGEGYHSLLAGLGRIDAAVGQRLLAGEPVGIMARTGKELPRTLHGTAPQRPADRPPTVAGGAPEH